MAPNIARLKRCKKTSCNRTSLLLLVSLCCASRHIICIQPIAQLSTLRLVGPRASLPSISNLQNCFVTSWNGPENLHNAMIPVMIIGPPWVPTGPCKLSHHCTGKAVVYNLGTIDELNYRVTTLVDITISL